MIVPMKKATIITQDKDADSTVSALRRLGVLHVEYEQAPAGEDINSLKDKITLVNSSLEVLSIKEFLIPGTVKPSKKLADWAFTAKHIIDLYKRIEQLYEYAATLTNRIGQLEPWGDFDPAQIAQLAGKDIFVRLYQIPIKEMALIPSGVVVKKVFTQGGIAYCAIISQGEVDPSTSLEGHGERSRTIEIHFKEISLPKMGLHQLRKRLTEDRQAMQSLKEEITKLTSYRAELIVIKNSLEKELELRQAIRGMGQSGALTYITGYVPFDKVGSVTQVAKQEKWGLVVREPEEEDNVPVLIRNPRWISLISPIFKFLEILPGYRELDISLLFLIFFSIFFGMLIGDAGYGLIYALITFLIQRKCVKKGMPQSVFYLFYILSLCAIVFGLLTGTFFGQEWLAKLGIKPLMPALTDQHNIQAVCFFIGALHLTIAHAWRFALKMPSLEALADAGWILVLWTAFFLAKTLVLGDSFPYFGNWLLVSGLALVILFTNPQRNILKGIAQGLGTVALSLMNNFTDVVSYVRLFAVGLAGVAIADAFNSMAALVGHKGILAIIVSAFILIVGHTLGIVLGPVSVLVHGVRLNVLEFSGHANVTWSGNAYKPLKE